MTAPVPSDHPNDFDTQTPEDQTEYVPEREFVLMPLFRRISEMLGRRTREQVEAYSEPVSKEERVPQEGEARSDFALPTYTAAEETFQPWSAPLEEASLSTESSDVLDLETHESGFSSFQGNESVPLEAAAGEPEELATPAVPVVAQTEPAETPASISEPNTPSNSFQPADVILALREATARVSAAIENAAEWLREKEDGILPEENAAHVESRSTATELSLVPEPLKSDDAGEVQEPTGLESSASEEVLPQSLEQEAWPEEVWPESEIPALQQEMAWREPGYSTYGSHSESKSLVEDRPPRPSPVAVARTISQSQAPRVPIWKQIDWSQQFTPKRVAVIGGLLMAALLAVGMSLARRPASSMLPEQSRTLEPGGVTVTTHPRPVPPRVPQNTTQSRKAASHSPASRVPRSDDGPDVVTHYYRQGKPSPVHQSTVAGVRHYSDLE